MDLLQPIFEMTFYCAVKKISFLEEIRQMIFLSTQVFRIIIIKNATRHSKVLDELVSGGINSHTHALPRQYGCMTTSLLRFLESTFRHFGQWEIIAGSWKGRNRMENALVA